MLRDVGPHLLAFADFPAPHWKKICTPLACSITTRLVRAD